MKGRKDRENNTLFLINNLILVLKSNSFELCKTIIMNSEGMISMEFGRVMKANPIDKAERIRYATCFPIEWRYIK